MRTFRVTVEDVAYPDDEPSVFLIQQETQFIEEYRIRNLNRYPVADKMALRLANLIYEQGKAIEGIPSIECEIKINGHLVPMSLLNDYQRREGTL